MRVGRAQCNGRRSSRVEAEDAVARRHHASGEVAVGVNAPVLRPRLRDQPPGAALDPYVRPTRATGRTGLGRPLEFA